MSSLQLKKMVGKIFLFLIATVKIKDNKHTVLLQPRVASTSDKIMLDSL